MFSLNFWFILPIFPPRNIRLKSIPNICRSWFCECNFDFHAQYSIILKILTFFPTSTSKSEVEIGRAVFYGENLLDKPSITGKSYIDLKRADALENILLSFQFKMIITRANFDSWCYTAQRKVFENTRFEK